MTDDDAYEAYRDGLTMVPHHSEPDAPAVPKPSPAIEATFRIVDGVVTECWPGSGAR